MRPQLLNDLLMTQANRLDASRVISMLSPVKSDDEADVGRTAPHSVGTFDMQLIKGYLVAQQTTAQCPALNDCLNDLYLAEGDHVALASSLRRCPKLQSPLSFVRKLHSSNQKEMRLLAAIVLVTCGDITGACQVYLDEDAWMDAISLALANPNTANAAANIAVDTPADNGRRDGVKEETPVLMLLDRFLEERSAHKITHLLRHAAASMTKQDKKVALSPAELLPRLVACLSPQIAAGKTPKIKAADKHYYGGDDVSAEGGDNYWFEEEVWRAVLPFLGHAWQSMEKRLAHLEALDHLRMEN